MAEEPSASSIASNSSNFAPPPPSQQDWEILSMSMSASTYGAPGSASVICVCDFCTGKAPSPPASCLAASRSVPNFPPSLDITGAEKLVTEGLRVESLPPSSSDGRDEASQPEASVHIIGGSQPEPFTDGWKPRRGNSPADLILDLAPTTLRLYPAIPATVYRDAYKKHEALIDKAVYAADAGKPLVIDEGSVESQSKLSTVEGEKLKKKSVKALRVWLWNVQAKDASTLWSIALAASVVGIVVLGYCWHRERCQNQQLRMQLSVQDEKICDLHHQVNQLKDIITGRRKVHIARTSY